MSTTTKPSGAVIVQNTGDSIGNSFSGFTGDPEAPARVEAEASGMFRGVWVSTVAFDVMAWGMHRTNVLISPEDAEELALGLLRQARKAAAVKG